jgi:riboflavin transporter FmnP
MFLVPAGMVHLPFFEKKSRTFNRMTIIILVSVIAIMVRVAVASIVNYYWAVPLFLSIPPAEVLTWFGGPLSFFAFVASMNVLQSIVDSVIPWFLAFKVKLSSHFGTW